MTTYTRRLSADIPSALLKRFKQLAVEKDTTIQNLVTEALTNYIQQQTADKVQP